MWLRFDPKNPPRKAPRGADALVWNLAYQLRQDHVISGGACVAHTCREAGWQQSPEARICPTRHVADCALVAATLDSKIDAYLGRRRWIRLNGAGRSAAESTWPLW